MNYRIIYKSEYKAIADIHKSAFSDFFLTSLGEDFLKVYYKACIRNGKTLSICAVDGEEVIKGFAIGCIRSKGYHKQLLINNPISFILYGIKIFLTRPQSILRLLNNIEKKPKKSDDGNYAELISIAVSPATENIGIGTELIRNFEDQARFLGCSKIALTTDFYNNEKVIAFYKKLGYSVYYDFTAFPNRKMYKLIKEII